MGDRLTDFTLVCGVDAKTLAQLSHTWPTWRRHKPGLLERRMLIFYDQEQVREPSIRAAVDHPDLWLHAWPPPGVRYEATSDDKWGAPQRHKMLAGFVHIPARFVTTAYWLKVDTDAIAMGWNDWVDPAWFTGDAAIIAPGWGFTKPADQMLKLDAWANGKPLFNNTSPLNLVPKPGEGRISHKRICSWCAFFNTAFTRQVADACPVGKLPVASQDGLLWYAAERLGWPIIKTNMKHKGWALATHGAIPHAAQAALQASL